jgi:hypothetical protein
MIVTAPRAGAISGKTVTIGGSVVDHLNQPINSATVSIQQGESYRNVLTTSRGSFSFSGPAGRYRITATKSGYLGGGDPDFPESAEAVELHDGDRLLNIVLRLSKPAVIAGRVQDESDDPIAGLTVRLMPAAAVGGRERFELPAAGPTGRTNDKGEYRIPLIKPGKYLVAIFAERPPGGEALSLIPIYALPLFFPNSAVLSGAVPIVLGSGEVRDGVNFEVPRAAPRIVSGHVEGLANNAPARVRLLTVSSGTTKGDVEIGRVSTTLSGHFELKNVPPGTFVISVVEFPKADRPRILISATPTGARIAGRRGSAGVPSPDESTYFGEVTINVEPDKDVSNIRVVVERGSPICGRLSFAGTTQPPSAEALQASEIWTLPSDRRNVIIPVSKLNTDGSFCTVGLIPGKYHVWLPPVFQGWHLLSVRQNGRDITGEPVEVSGLAVKDLVLQFTDRDTEIFGTVRNEKGAPVPSATVLLFPTEQRLWSDFGPTPIRITEVRTRRDGTYTISHVIPGRYRVVALKGPAGPRWTLYENLAQLSQAALTIEPSHGQRTLANLTSRSPQ